MRKVFSTKVIGFLLIITALALFYQYLAIQAAETSRLVVENCKIHPTSGGVPCGFGYGFGSWMNGNMLLLGLTIIIGATFLVKEKKLYFLPMVIINSIFFGFFWVSVSFLSFFSTKLTWAMYASLLLPICYLFLYSLEVRLFVKKTIKNK